MIKNVQILSVLSVCLLAACTVRENERTSQPQATVGTIKFAQRMESDQRPGGNQCFIQVPAAGSPAKTYKMKDTSCNNDVVSFVKFENVPSSTQLILYSEGDCNDSDRNADWRFGLRAYINPTTTGWFGIEGHVYPTPEGRIVVEGLLKGEHHYERHNIEGKLSCVKVIPPEL